MQYLFMSAVMSVSFLYSCFQMETTSEATINPVVATPSSDKNVANKTAPFVEVSEIPATTLESTEESTTTTTEMPRQENPVTTEPRTKLSVNTIPGESIDNPAPQSEPFPDEENPRMIDLPTKDVPKTIDANPNFALSHDKFDVLLRRYVSSSGKVDYKGFKKEKAALEAYLKLLQNNAPQSDWSKNKEMAYWINLYNAFTIKTILDEYPVKSVMDIDGGKVWDKRTIRIGGKSYTLNDIEKKQLLKRFRDGRVHFAVNCAAASCPPLLNKAWTEDNLQRYLSKQAKAFINNATHNSLSVGSVQLSQIFNWYADDFGGKDKVLSYIQKYASTEIKSNAKVSFKTYNWSLND